MISKKEADKFLAVLTNTNDTFEKDSSKKNEILLNTLIYNFHQKVPFQNIKLLAKPLGTQDIPSLEEIFSDVLAFQGGLCYTNNVFIKCFLEGYGFNVDHIAATCNLKHPNNHIITKVAGLTNNSLHLAEVGCGYQTFNLIDLNKCVKEDVMYEDGFLKYKYIHDENEYTRLHFQDFKTDKEQLFSPKWERYYSFSLEPQGLDFFNSAMEEVYKDRFLKKLRALIFKGDDMHVLKESGTSAIQLIITPLGTSQTQLNSNEEIINAISQMLPMLPSDTVRKAVCNWRTITKK